jgi:hypothetical protein
MITDPMMSLDTSQPSMPEATFLRHHHARTNFGDFLRESPQILAVLNRFCDV